MDSTPEIFKMIQARIDHDRLWLSVAIACFAIGIMLASVASSFPEFFARLFLLLGLFMSVFGFVMSFLLVEQVMYHIGHYKDWGEAHLSAFRKERGISIDEPKSEPIEPKQPINVIHETKDSQGRISTWTIENHPDRPSFDFIKYVYTCKDDSNLIPTVRELQDEGKLNGLWNTAQVVKWLTIFDQLEITTKVYDMERGNSRRCLKRGMTLNEIREKFGYDPVSP